MKFNKRVKLSGTQEEDTNAHYRRVIFEVVAGNMCVMSVGKQYSP